MPRISFSVDKRIEECIPELVNKLRHVSSVDEVSELEDEYGLNEVVDTMLSIAEEEGTYKNALTEDTITDWLWQEYYEHCHEYVRDAFVDSVHGEWKIIEKGDTQ